MVGLPMAELDSFWRKEFSELEAGDEATHRLDLFDGAGQRPTRSMRGFRLFLEEQQGSGYWDFFRPADAFYISMARARFRKKTYVNIEGEHYFKVRILLAGKLLNMQGETLLESGHAVAFLAPGQGRDGFFIAADTETKLLVLHCQPKVLTETLGLTVSAVPPPFDRLFGPPQAGSLHRIALGPEVLSAAQRIIESRDQIPATVRAPYLEAMATSILCQIIADLSNSNRIRLAQSSLNARDLNRIYETRDYLAQHFAAPPRIPQLARMVGINQTKLKAGFKEVLGVTIYDYILGRRMDRACELLVTQDYPIATIAHMVGYEHAANFTGAFKRHLGCLPRAWKRRRGSQRQIR